MALVAIVAGYVVLRLQDVLPLNQGGIPAMSPELAFNTSVSFETNTNWQNYSGETGATYLTQAASSRSATSPPPRRGWPSPSPCSAA